MTELNQEKLKRLLQSVEGLYHRLILLVGQSGSGKTAVLCDVADELGVKVININLELSSHLLELTAKQRLLRLPELLNQLTDTDYSIVMLDNLEILFDRELKQNPLRLLQGISRNRTVIASWNGKLAEGKLTYAEPGHPEHRSYELDDILIVNVDEV